MDIGLYAQALRKTELAEVIKRLLDTGYLTQAEADLVWFATITGRVPTQSDLTEDD